MGSTADMIEVLCLVCGERYLEWYKPLFDGPPEAVCPHCGHDPANDWLLYENGVDPVGDDEEDAHIR